MQAIAEVLKFAELLRNELGIIIDTYDFGGGYGVPTVCTPNPWDQRMPEFGYSPRMPFPSDCPDLEDYASGIEELFSKVSYDFKKTSPRVILEPGRAITSSSQILLLGVVTVKKTKGALNRVILDGGKNLTIPLGYETHQIFSASKMRGGKNEKVDLYGPLCHPGDIVARCKTVPDLKSGDIIAVMDAGAYFIPNQLNFSQTRPPVVMIDDGCVKEIRSRGNFYGYD